MTTHPFLAFSFVLACAAASFAQDSSGGADVEILIKERVASATTLSVEDVWRASRTLATAAGEGGQEKIDAAVDRILGNPSTLSDKALLLVAALRLKGTDVDVAKLTTRLETLLASKDDEVASAAAGLFTDSAFHALKDEEKDGLIKELGTLARDASRSPELRLSAAVALYVRGGAAAQRDGRKGMMDFLASSDAHLRGRGALALARVGDVETARTELERMAAAPDAEGELAASYLKQEDIRRMYDRRQKNILDYAKKQVETTNIEGTHDVVLLEKLMRMIEQTSLEGDKVKRDDLMNAAMDGMMHSLDEHSSFLTPKQYKEFEQDLLSPEYGGIGAYVGEDPEDHLFTIRQPIYSGPAYEKGLHSDDKIVRIDEWPTFTPQGMRPVDEIIKKLKGKPGTKVKLYIWRRGMDPALIDRPTDEMSVEIVRREITIPPVKADLLPGGIAHIELTTFSKVASNEIREKLLEFRDKGMKAVILDLRQNTGGLLDEARNVANLFLPKRKLVATVESRLEDPEQKFTLQDALLPADMPVAVLISRFSASASEIVSGALQDHQRATIVGQRSYGKGSVQQLLPIKGENDDEYKDENRNGRHDSWEPLTKDWNKNGEFDFAPRARMTIARYLLPSGRSIHREFDEKGNITSEGGVEPDVKVDPRRYESWKLDEFSRILKSRKVRDYVDQNYAREKELFLRLAASDEDDTTQYPGFENLYQSLETTLSRQDVRFLVRREIRGRAQDARGAAYPDGDFEEDPMLQGAIKSVLEKLGRPIEELPSYAKTFDKPDAKKDADKLATLHLSDNARTDLRHALTLIEQGKSQNAQLSPDRLAEIEKALHAVLDK